MPRIPRVLSVYAASTAERRWHLANYREQPDGDQSKLHDQPLGTEAYARRALNSSGRLRLSATHDISVLAAQLNFPVRFSTPSARSQKPSRFGLGSCPASRPRLTPAAGDAHLNVTPYGQMNFGR